MYQVAFNNITYLRLSRKIQAKLITLPSHGLCASYFCHRYILTLIFGPTGFILEKSGNHIILILSGKCKGILNQKVLIYGYEERFPYQKFQ